MYPHHLSDPEMTKHCCCFLRRSHSLHAPELSVITSWHYPGWHGHKLLETERGPGRQESSSALLLRNFSFFCTCKLVFKQCVKWPITSSTHYFKVNKQISARLTSRSSLFVTSSTHCPYESHWPVSRADQEAPCDGWPRPILVFL